MQPPETVKVKPRAPEQGNYLIINKEDFIEGKDEIYDGPENPEPSENVAPKSFDELQAQVAELQAKLSAMTPVAVDSGEAPANGAWGDTADKGKAGK